MKTPALVLLFVLPLALSAQEIQTGATLAEVRATLGVPRGRMTAGERQVLCYERGEVELRGGIVTRVALLSAEDLAAREARRSAEAGRLREEREIQRARLAEEGAALKARKLADPNFAATAPDYQVAFWQDFAVRYPDVPSAEQLRVARLEQAALAARLAQQAQAARIAELEARLDESEQRAEESPRRERIYVSSGRGSRHRGHGSDLWPVEYDFAGAVTRPLAATVSYPAWGTTPYDLRQQAAEAARNEADARGRSHRRRERF